MRTPFQYLRDEGIFGYNYRYIILHFWIIPGEVYRRVKWFIQRGMRGYSDRDAWDMSMYLTRICIPMLKYLKKYKRGYPAGLTAKKWDKILDGIIRGFKANQKWANLDWKKDGWKLLKKDSEMGLRLFAKHYNSLWD